MTGAQGRRFTCNTLAWLAVMAMPCGGLAESVKLPLGVGVPAFCLPVHPAVDDGAQLRLAAAPLSGQSIGGPLQTYLYRYLGGGALALASTKNQQTPAGLPPVLAPAPVIRLLIDGSNDLLGGRLQQARQELVQCGQLAAKEKDDLVQAACDNNLAAALALQGELGLAKPELDRALSLYQSITPSTERTKPSIGGLFAAQSEPQDRSIGIERVTLNLGNLALAAGRMPEAEALFRQALESHANQSCRAAAADDLARLERRLGRPVDFPLPAVPPLRQSVSGMRKRNGKPDRTEGDDGSAVLIELGVVHLATATATPTPTGSSERPVAKLEPWRSPRTIGNDFHGAAAGTEPWKSPRSNAPDTPSDVKVSANAAVGSSPIGRFDDASLSSLLAEASGVTPQGAGKADSWQRLALRSAAARRPDLGFSAESALMRLFANQNELDKAVLHGKLAANLAQASRAALADRSPSRDARRAFLRDRRQTYVTLAQLLLDQKRLAEAESVLQLLKEDEGQQFVEGNSANGLGSLWLTTVEQSRQATQQEAVRQLQVAEQSRASAVSGMPLGANMLLMETRPQVEAARLRLGLALPGLATRLRTTPLVRPSFVDSTQLVDFLVGPGNRSKAFLAHLIEDVPFFTSGVGAADRAKLAETLQRLPQIRAELAPLLNDSSSQASPSGSFSVHRAGASREDPSDSRITWDFIAAEPMEWIWRGMRDGDRIEADFLSHTGEPMLPVEAAAVATDERSDTVALLAHLPEPTALLYYLPGNDRLDVLLVSALGRKHLRLAVTRTELNAAIDDFTHLLRQPERDPRAAAQKMYRLLFAPIQDAVAESGARTLALSLTDKLRFVPFAALHTGDDWLVERYAFAVHPGGRLAERLKPASRNWRVAAFGASMGSEEFPPLPNVRREIASIVSHGAGAAGVMGGEASLDEAFSAARLRSAVNGGAQVVHIASHFKFVGGDATASYLVLGDGSRLSLHELAGPEYRFNRTELVTLSACATALSADDTYGQEVDGLAALLMGQGASSVLASLWDVNDESTSTLMASIYRLRESKKLSRASALQHAQLEMIHSANGSTGSDPSVMASARGASRVNLTGDPDPMSSTDAPPGRLGLGHPYYWSAFVLMGNWL